MVGLGTAATVVSIRRRQPRGIWLSMGYFTVMELLQATGYAVVDQCGTLENRTITLLSYLHIVFQPFFINAFAMELVPGPVRTKIRNWVFGLCAVSALAMLVQLLPLQFAGACQPGVALCGDVFCLTSGEWHIAWQIPYNGLLNPIDNLLGIHFGFPTYMLTVFVLPLVYGAWRFVAMHVVVGPVLASYLTANPNEMPAIWCLFSICILLIGASPLIRRNMETENWWLWPQAWRA